MKNGSRLIVTEYKGSILSVKISSEGKTQAISCENPKRPGLIGNIYAGTVTNVVEGIGGAFVDMGDGQMGFLHLRGADPVFLSDRRTAGALRQGDVILVQVAADAQKMKEPSLTCEISLAGKYAVLVSSMKGCKISSRIREKTLRDNFESMGTAFEGSGFGFIIRTKAADADPQQVNDEISRLSDTWSRIIKIAGEKKKGLIRLAEKCYVRDYLEDSEEDICEIVTDDFDSFMEIKKYMEENYPEDKERLRMYNDTRVPFKTVYGFERIMNEAVSKKVNLKSGGFLIIEPTEAMVVIDVNSGRSIYGKRSKGDFLKINLEAAAETVRQIRLRNLSGMIIVDFISMVSPEDNSTLMSELKNLLKDDPLRAKVVDMTALGLVEITRKKVRRPLYEIMDI